MSVFRSKYYLITILLFLISCDNEIAEPMEIIYRVDSSIGLPSAISIEINGVENERFELMYDSVGFIENIHHLIQDETVERCEYTFENEKLVSKSWWGMVDEGIHGNGQSVQAEYQFSYSNQQELNNVYRELHSNLSPHTSITSMGNHVFVFENSNYHNVDSLRYVIDSNSTTLFENDWLSYSFINEQGELTYIESGDTTRVLFSNYELNDWPTEILLLLDHLISEQEDNILLNDVSEYFDLYLQARLQFLPVQINGTDIYFEVDTFGRLTKMVLSPEKELYFIYAE